MRATCVGQHAASFGPTSITSIRTLPRSSHRLCSFVRSPTAAVPRFASAPSRTPNTATCTNSPLPPAFELSIATASLPAAPSMSPKCTLDSQSWRRGREEAPGSAGSPSYTPPASVTGAANTPETVATRSCSTVGVGGGPAGSAGADEAGGAFSPQPASASTAMKGTRYVNG